MFGKSFELTDTEVLDPTVHCSYLAGHIWTEIACSAVHPLVSEILELSSPEDVAAEVVVDPRLEVELTVQDLLTAKECLENSIRPIVEAVIDKLDVIGPNATAYGKFFPTVGGRNLSERARENHGPLLEAWREVGVMPHPHYWVELPQQYLPDPS